MIKNICTVILLLLSVLPAAGQNRVKVKISGNVITTDGAPAEYITVSLKNTVFGGMSDGDGNFEFAAPPGEYTMVVQSVTAHRKEFPVTIETGRENVFPNIEVKEDINQLEEVVVTGQFSPQSMKNSLYKVRSVNSDQIRQKAPLDVQSLLNTEIGIRLSNDMALGETDFELMGMSGNNVKILMDGIPMIDRGSTKQSLSQLDVNRIERVEIVEGPMSVVYGTDALAGVINIITKRDRAIPAKAPGAWAPASRKKRWARNTSSSTAKVFTTKASTSDSILKTDSTSTAATPATTTAAGRAT